MLDLGRLLSLAEKGVRSVCFRCGLEKPIVAIITKKHLIFKDFQLILKILQLNFLKLV
jgi:hypothetical protein